MKRRRTETINPIEFPNVLIIGVQTPENAQQDIESYFDEFRNLVDSCGVLYTTEHYVKLRSIDNAYFFTKGKLQEIDALCKENNIEHVIVSEMLTTQQLRNLGKLLHARVFDRTELILEIFERGAQSAEGKLQVGIAMLQHKKSLLAGKGINLSQQSGKLGTKGPGETQKEVEARHLEQLMVRMRRDLKQLEKVRATQRKQRQKKGIPHVSLIGYTNAGKSTVLNALTKSDVLAEDKLFATLDTTTRELFVYGVKKGVISDTVGFIQQLPHKLIEAFKSTLTELAYSDLLLQVIDVSDPNWPQHIEVVHDILDELEVEKPMLYVFNKADVLTPEEVGLMEGYLRKYRPAVLVSALTKKGLEPLTDFLANWDPRAE